MKRRNIGVILAGGTGARFGGNLPKQFMKVAGKMVIEHTVDSFQNSAVMDEIAIVINNNYRHIGEQMLLHNSWSKVRKLLDGGKERYDSTLAAVKAYEGEDVNLILHDAVRPMVSERILRDIDQALGAYQAIDVAVRASDTIVMSDGDCITKIPRRAECFQGQTPQAFWLETLKKAYDIALADPHFVTTDDCGVVVKYLPDVPVKVVEGDVQNIKLTYMEDFYLLDKLFQLRVESMPSSTGQISMRDNVLVCFGGSEGIGKEICKLAKSRGANVFSFSRKETNTDVSDYGAVKSAFDAVYTATGRINYVVLTAGLLQIAPFHTSDRQQMDQLMDVNYKGAVYVSQCAYPYLKESKGSLLHFTSSSYTYGRPLYGLYSSAKAAVVNLTQGLAQEWQEVGIRVNCINPERTKTGMRVRAFGREDEHTLLEPAKVAEASIAVLLSEKNGVVTDVRRSETNRLI